MKKILAAFVTIVLFLGLIGVGTWAFFSDREISSGNIFRAGTWTNNPSLSLDPDDAKTNPIQNPVLHSISVTNSGDEPKDFAKNVELEVTVVKGEEYVEKVDYNPVLGNIEAKGKREFSLAVYLTPAWQNAPKGTEIKLRIEVTREDNWPEHNIGKRAHFTIVKEKGSTPTPTPTATATVTVTPTVTVTLMLTPTVTPTPTATRVPIPILTPDRKSVV